MDRVPERLNVGNGRTRIGAPPASKPAACLCIVRRVAFYATRKPADGDTTINGRLESFRDFLRILSDEFKIDGLDQLDPPDWTVMI